MEQEDKNIHKIIECYPVGSVQECKKISNGLVHSTWEIKTSKGLYILQRLHVVLSDQCRLRDFVSVTEHLRSKGLESPELIRSKTGDLVVVDQSGKKWRLQTRLIGESPKEPVSGIMIEKMAELLGKFHVAISDIKTPLESPRLLHDTKGIYQKLVNIYAIQDLSCVSKNIQEDINFILENLPLNFLPDNLPKRVIHGDPKISNFLVCRKRPVALIDLDTCQFDTVLADIGDALRSWCGGEEDSNTNSFSLPVFTSAWRGYKRGSGDLLSEAEKRLVSQSVALITLELAARFAIDIFEDNYFGWDSSRYESRVAHNTARLHGQVTLSTSILAQTEKMNGLVFV